jgi:hypothetical protein
MSTAARWVWANRLTALQLVGLVFLVWYFARYGVTFDAIWVLAYLGLALILSLMHGLLLNPLLERFFPSQRVDIESVGARIFEPVKRHPLRTFSLIPGEDGLFFVPLLLVGVTPVTTALASALFGLAHYPLFPVKHCIVKGTLFFLVTVLILPHGLATVVVGHLLLDGAVLVAWTLASRASAGQSANE